MTFAKAKGAVKKAGVSRAKGNAELSVVCQALASANPAYSAEMLYNGAKKRGLDGPGLWKRYKERGPVEVGWIMFD